jgi:hypothetical protein
VQAVQVLKTNWFLMRVFGYALFGGGLFMVGVDYYYFGRVLHGTFQEASMMMLLGLVMIATATATKKSKIG